ncbi:putative ABC transport system permease protein [Mesorhizobium soli]|jgi:putative ABC transport system permease protein|uniref:ABC transporter permease n=1 Tax=Pseudaminobacter soli (ex Li et al. 2025) TaxID=1295366 RepID=UPI002472F0A2|nr:ABC transporter permease [Mesorhizobium soli]MDH6233264.1 putative ABC transport system permease protein [Mesorhizobium soli]
MSSTLKQTLVMTRANLLSLPRRFAIAASMALSVALVVCVLAGFLSMAAGFEKALKSAGSSTVAVILGGGTNQENGSDVPADVIRTIEARRGDIGAVRDTAGNLVSSREIVVPVEMADDQAGVEKILALRGMDPIGPSLRDGVTLTAGRFTKPGAREVVVGERIATEFPSLAVGKQVRLGSVNWRVVGHFSSAGSAFESELWADLDAVHSAFDQLGEVQSVRLRLDGTGAIERLKTALGGITTTPLIVVTEADLYAAQSSGTANLIRMFGWPVALLMALGATAGALNTMMSSVSDRTIEIATVRALGFSRLSAFVATWAEAMVLAVVGVSIGLVASRFLFSGWQASTIGTNNTSIAFELTLSEDVMLTAGLLGLAIGAIGGALPAFSATRLPLTAALRARG